MQNALDMLESMPGCLSACLLTANGEILTGSHSAIKADSAHLLLLNILKVKGLYWKAFEKVALRGVTIMDKQKRIITRFAGKTSERVLLAIELAENANEQLIKFKIYSLFPES
jgi:hypothetical protein